MSSWSPYVKEYDPLKCGSIDGTDSVPHDRGVCRAMQASYRPNKKVVGEPRNTIFVGRLSMGTTENMLEEYFEEFGKIKKIRLVRDIVTGFSKRYAFVEYVSPWEAENARREANGHVIDEHEIFVDYEHERTLPGWIPRRFGGGLGGKKEAGQLRFGGRDRPFRKPIVLQNLEQGRINEGDMGQFENPRRDEDRDRSRRDRGYDRDRGYNRDRNRDDRNRDSPYTKDRSYRRDRKRSRSR